MHEALQASVTCIHQARHFYAHINTWRPFETRQRFVPHGCDGLACELPQRPSFGKPCLESTTNCLQAARNRVKSSSKHQLCTSFCQRGGKVCLGNCSLRLSVENASSSVQTGLEQGALRASLTWQMLKLWQVCRCSPG